MNKKYAICLVKQKIRVACFTCTHYYEKMQRGSHYYPYMGVPSCNRGKLGRDLCLSTDYGGWVPDNVHSVLEVVRE